jgi:DNA polymerase III alpha subunit
MTAVIDFDVDIDMANRDDILRVLPHVPASIEKDGSYTRHNTGVYFQNIPVLPLEQIAALDYKAAEQAGFFKVDFLNNHVYKNVRDEAHLDQLVQAEPMWELLQHTEVIETLFHVSNYAPLVKSYAPQSLEELAMLLAIIRPGKKHLQGQPWHTIRETVWEKPQNSGYHFRKCHAFSYAMVIVVQLNLLAQG